MGVNPPAFSLRTSVRTLSNANAAPIDLGMRGGSCQISTGLSSRTLNFGFCRRTHGKLVLMMDVVQT
jgi:hypothetical protein